jgi:hypothetical protein
MPFSISEFGHLNRFWIIIWNTKWRQAPLSEAQWPTCIRATTGSPQGTHHTTLPCHTGTVVAITSIFNAIPARAADPFPLFSLMCVKTSHLTLSVLPSSLPKSWGATVLIPSTKAVLLVRSSSCRASVDSVGKAGPHILPLLIVQVTSPESRHRRRILGHHCYHNAIFDEVLQPAPFLLFFDV